MKGKNVAFLFSGRGSLLNSVINGINKSKTDSILKLVITNNTSINHDRFDDYNFHIIDHKQYDCRTNFEKEIINLLEINNIELIVLGGFRRIFTPTFVDKYGN
ncbi:formyltransferase family protein, partial [Rodentibacter pneumotropicus]|uniref:formyltransferase family protein n=1 Tax=Rodentibacter pneumotropicus TaxID=758 RepID=UPI001C4DFFAB